VGFKRERRILFFEEKCLGKSKGKNARDVEGLKGRNGFQNVKLT
jgi:hypothetical protein